MKLLKVALLVIAVVGGCAGDGEDRAAARPTPTPQLATTEPVPTPTALPAHDADSVA